MGLILNRPGEVKGADLWESISPEHCESEAVAFSGGPVQQNAITFLHDCGDLAPDAESVVPGAFLGSELELLAKIIGRSGEGGKNKTAEILRVCCGHSGWAEGQLDSEMKAGGWLTIPASDEHVFQLPPEKLWSGPLDSLGGVYRFSALMPRNPEMN